MVEETNWAEGGADAGLDSGVEFGGGAMGVGESRGCDRVGDVDESGGSEECVCAVVARIGDGCIADVSEAFRELVDGEL